MSAVVKPSHSLSTSPVCSPIKRRLGDVRRCSDRRSEPDWRCIAQRRRSDAQRSCTTPRSTSCGVSQTSPTDFISPNGTPAPSRALRQWRRVWARNIGSRIALSSARWVTRSGAWANLRSSIRSGRPIAGQNSLPELVVGDADIDPAVLGLERFVGRDGGVDIAAPFRAHAGGKIDAGIEGQKRRHGVEHGDVEPRAEAGAFATQQCGKDGLRGVEARNHVGDGGSDLGRLAVRFAGNIHDAGLTLHDQIVARTSGVGARSAKPGDAAEDQVAVVARQRVIAEPEPLERSGPEILHHDVGHSAQPQHQLLAGARSSGRWRNCACCGSPTGNRRFRRRERAGRRRGSRRRRRALRS